MALASLAADFAAADKDVATFLRRGGPSAQTIETIRTDATLDEPTRALLLATLVQYQTTTTPTTTTAATATITTPTSVNAESVRAAAATVYFPPAWREYPPYRPEHEHRLRLERQHSCLHPFWMQTRETLEKNEASATDNELVYSQTLEYASDIWVPYQGMYTEEEQSQLAQFLGISDAQETEWNARILADAPTTILPHRRAVPLLPDIDVAPTPPHAGQPQQPFAKRRRDDNKEGGSGPRIGLANLPYELLDLVHRRANTLSMRSYRDKASQVGELTALMRGLEPKRLYSIGPENRLRATDFNAGLLWMMKRMMARAARPFDNAEPTPYIQYLGIARFFGRFQRLSIGFVRPHAWSPLKPTKVIVEPVVVLDFSDGLADFVPRADTWAKTFGQWTADKNDPDVPRRGCWADETSRLLHPRLGLAQYVYPFYSRQSRKVVSEVLPPAMLETFWTGESFKRTGARAWDIVLDEDDLLTHPHAAVAPGHVFYDNGSICGQLTHVLEKNGWTRHSRLRRYPMAPETELAYDAYRQVQAESFALERIELTQAAYTSDSGGANVIAAGAVLMDRAWPLTVETLKQLKQLDSGGTWFSGFAWIPLGEEPTGGDDDDNVEPSIGAFVTGPTGPTLDAHMAFANAVVAECQIYVSDAEVASPAPHVDFESTQSVLAQWWHRLTRRRLYIAQNRVLDAIDATLTEVFAEDQFTSVTAVAEFAALRRIVLACLIVVIEPKPVTAFHGGLEERSQKRSEAALLNPTFVLSPERLPSDHPLAMSVEVRLNIHNRQNPEEYSFNMLSVAILLGYDKLTALLDAYDGSVDIRRVIQRFVTRMLAVSGGTEPPPRPL